jgi:hypothetical protein
MEQRLLDAQVFGNDIGRGRRRAVIQVANNIGVVADKQRDRIA